MIVFDMFVYCFMCLYISFYIGVRVDCISTLVHCKGITIFYTHKNINTF